VLPYQVAAYVAGWYGLFAVASMAVVAWLDANSITPQLWVLAIPLGAVAACLGLCLGLRGGVARGQLRVLPHRALWRQRLTGHLGLAWGLYWRSGVLAVAAKWLGMPLAMALTQADEPNGFYVFALIQIASVLLGADGAAYTLLRWPLGRTRVICC
jgi:hypothetical protein